MTEDKFPNIPCDGAAHVLDFTIGVRKLHSYMYHVDQQPPPEIKELIGFYNIWQTHKKPDKIPSWSDFSFEEFVGWHSNVRVMESGNSPADKKRVLIMGETYSSYWGRKSMYDQIHSENPPPQEFINLYYKYLEHIFNHHFALTIGVLPTMSGNAHSIMFLDLPLANNGQDVSHLLSAILPA